MALVNMRDLLNHAYHGHYAVGAFDVISLEFLQGVLQGAEEARAPVILNFVVPQFRYYDFELLAAAAVAGARRSPVPVALHLDHAADLDHVTLGIRHGCNGVMIDGSHLPFEKNVELTRSVVQTAHGCGIAVEGELGIITGYAGDDQAESGPGVYTWPDEARQYVRQTKVDFLAVSVGTVHGIRPERSDLDLERLTRINRAVGIPLVIHGGSGLTDAQCECLIDRGVARINYYSGLSQIAARRLRSNCLVDRTGGAAALNQGVSEAVRREVARCLAVWGAAGRAEDVFAAASPWQEVEHLIVYNSTDTDAHVEEMMEEGRRTLGAIPGVRRVFAGRAIKEGAKYRYCWLVRFAHPKVVDSYRDDPGHVAFADTRFRPTSAARISIDFQDTDAAAAAVRPADAAGGRRVPG
ncbi:MAG: class II fructose-bisphosphate aldolase [Gammaproteobacteria bacterium]